jgi:ABC-type transporter Mla subunit MlaD
VKVVQRTDLYVGIFIVVTVGLVVAALVVTSGWGQRRFDLHIKSSDVTDVAIDTKIFLQGLEVGRVASIDPRPSRKRGELEFVVHASMVAQFPDKTPLRLTCNIDAEVISGFLGGASVELHVDNDASAIHHDGRPCVAPDSLMENDTIGMHRRPAAMAAFGNLAVDLKSTLSNAINAATVTLTAYRRLADSLSRATGTARGFVEGIRPGTEQTLAEVTANLARVRRLLDTADVRSGSTFHQVDLTLEQTRATMTQSRALMASADSLTKLLGSMGAENRPELRAMLLDARFLTQQLMYVMEQLSRRPMRAMSGVQLPESLTAEGRARRMQADSIARADSMARDTTPHVPRPTPRP